MEHKLAEFRARRAARQDGGAVCLSETPATVLSDGGGEAETAAASRQTEELSKSTSDRWDWLRDSALGRWLVSGKFAFSTLTLLKVMLWLVLLGLFAELDFGLPFFLISLFYWLYEGLRSPAARQPGELSAYSVFNPDCQPLLGTLTAEQLEGEMGYRPVANR
uniref:SAYSVFN motif domain containing 1 n=1 Tax=Myripristis murdjan TaxID=586833 RepID=A0A667ZSD4_9TELE